MQYSARGQDDHTINNKQHTKPKIINAFRLVEIISLSSKGVIRGVFSANHLTSNDNLTSNTQETEHKQANVNTKVALVNNNTHTKTYANRKDRQIRITVAFTTSATK